MSAPEHEPWVRYRDTGLYAVPSIHHRQVFAQLVFDACYRKRFDVIAVELPASFQNCGLVEAVLGCAPAPALIIHPEDGAEGSVSVPVNDDPDCRETEVRRVRNGRCFPVTPCDSMVMALRCPTLLRRRWPDWKPEIALVDAEHLPADRPGGTLGRRDDYAAMVDGLPAFIGRMEPRLELARYPEVDDHRERVMGARLRRFLDRGKEVLFVCGAAHWHSICRYLDSGARDAPESCGEPPESRLIAAPIKPEIAWLLGWLDDFPRAVWELEKSCRRGSVRRYDKLRSVRSVIRGSVEECGKRGIPVSIRRLQNLERFTDALTTGTGRWVPELDGCLVKAAEACVDGRFADVLKAQALMFPAKPPPGTEMARVARTDEGRWIVEAGGEAFVVALPESEGTRRRWNPAPPPAELTEAERRTMKHGLGSYPLRDWPEEIRLRMIMDLRVRGLVERKESKGYSRKFGGSTGFGIDCRRTIRARAGGEEAIYVRQSRAVVKPRSKTGGVVPPVAWVFDDQSPIVDRDGLAFYMPGGYWAYCLLHYAVRVDRIASGTIRRFRSGACVDLGISKGFLGKGRLREMSQEKEIAVDTAYMKSIPTGKRCLTPAWGDPELCAFAGIDQAVASAIRYAEDEIVLVSHPNMPISAQVGDYARARNVRIHRIPLGSFEPERIERLRWMHWVPSPNGYNKPPFPWCTRFVPPIQ